MKKRLAENGLLSILLAGVLFFISATSNGQSHKLPPFRMMQANGKVFKAEDLPVGKPILLVYFSPDCDHCIKMLRAFFKDATGFKKASLAFITFLTLDKVATFEKSYGLKQYPNLYLGTEGTSFFVRNYFKIRELPFVALYNKNGDFIRSYSKDIDWKDLRNRLRSLP